MHCPLSGEGSCWPCLPPGCAFRCWVAGRSDTPAERCRTLGWASSCVEGCSSLPARLVRSLSTTLIASRRRPRACGRASGSWLFLWGGGPAPIAAMFVRRPSPTRFYRLSVCVCSGLSAARGAWEAIGLGLAGTIVYFCRSRFQARATAVSERARARVGAKVGVGVGGPLWRAATG